MDKYTDKLKPPPPNHTYNIVTTKISNRFRYSLQILCSEDCSENSIKNQEYPGSTDQVGEDLPRNLKREN